MASVRCAWVVLLFAVLAGGVSMAAAAPPADAAGAVKEAAPAEAPQAPATLPALPEPGSKEAADVRARAVEKDVPPPPQPLHKVGDHWTPYDPPAVPEGVEPHVVVKGDTLWGIAQEAYTDPYMWPVIWDANRWITHSHWIYPGDPIIVPSKPVVVTENGPVAEPEPVVEHTPPVEPLVKTAPAKVAPAPKGPALVPAAEMQEMACAPQLLEQFDPAPLTVAGREVREKELQAQGDVLYLSAGRDMQIKSGMEYVIERPGPAVKAPGAKKASAVYVRRIGRVRVIAVQSNSATAEVALSCDGVQQGDFLVPYKETPIPMIERVPLSKLAHPNPGRMVGQVIVVGDPEGHIAGDGEIVGIDLSSHAGLTAGDRVLFWREGGVGPREVLAQGVVLATNGGGSMVKILEATEEVKPGDKVEIL